MLLTAKEVRQMKRRMLADALNEAGVKAQVRTAGRLLKIIVDDGNHAKACDVANRNGFGNVIQGPLEPRHVESDGKTIFAFQRG